MPRPQREGPIKQMPRQAVNPVCRSRFKDMVLPRKEMRISALCILFPAAFDGKIHRFQFFADKL